MVLSILLGNVIYFAAAPFLPASLTHSLYKVDAGLLVDFAICTGVYLVLRKIT